MQRSIRENQSTTPFSALTTADEEGLDGIDLARQRIIVTCGAAGIGIETARSLASSGAEVTSAVRSLFTGEQAATQIADCTGSKQVLVAPLDLADQASAQVVRGNLGWSAVQNGQRAVRGGSDQALGVRRPWEVSEQTLAA